jgi:hypothetical protein
MQYLGDMDLDLVLIQDLDPVCSGLVVVEEVDIMIVLEVHGLVVLAVAAVQMLGNMDIQVVVLQHLEVLCQVVVVNLVLVVAVVLVYLILLTMKMVVPVVLE